jgi:hypothetical protein
MDVPSAREDTRNGLPDPHMVRKIPIRLRTARVDVSDPAAETLPFFLLVRLVLVASVVAIDFLVSRRFGDFMCVPVHCCWTDLAREERVSTTILLVSRVHKIIDGRMHAPIRYYRMSPSEARTEVAIRRSINPCFRSRWNDIVAICHANAWSDTFVVRALRWCAFSLTWTEERVECIALWINAEAHVDKCPLAAESVKGYKEWRTEYMKDTNADAYWGGLELAAVLLEDDPRCTSCVLERGR